MNLSDLCNNCLTRILRVPLRPVIDNVRNRVFPVSTIWRNNVDRTAFYAIDKARVNDTWYTQLERYYGRERERNQRQWLVDRGVTVQFEPDWDRRTDDESPRHLDSIRVGCWNVHIFPSPMGHVNRVLTQAIRQEMGAPPSRRMWEIGRVRFSSEIS